MEDNRQDLENQQSKNQQSETHPDQKISGVQQEQYLRQLQYEQQVQRAQQVKQLQERKMWEEKRIAQQIEQQRMKETQDLKLKSTRIKQEENSQSSSFSEVYSQQETTRRTFYSVVVVSLLFEIALLMIGGLIMLSFGLISILGTKDGWKPLILFVNHLLGVSTITTFEETIIPKVSMLPYILFFVGILLLIFSVFWLVPLTTLNVKFFNQVGTKKEQQHKTLAICTLMFSANPLATVFMFKASWQAPDYKK